MIVLRQQAEDPDRITGIVIINRVRSHQAAPFTVPQRTGAHGRPQASILRATSPARPALGRTRTAHRTHYSSRLAEIPLPLRSRSQRTADKAPLPKDLPNVAHSTRARETSSHLRSHGQSWAT